MSLPSTVTGGKTSGASDPDDQCEKWRCHDNFPVIHLELCLVVVSSTSDCRGGSVSQWEDHLSSRVLSGDTVDTVLDGKTGLLTGLLGGKQGWKCPVTLITTCCGSKSLKVILSNSNFVTYPVLNPKLYTPCADFSKPVEELEYRCLLKSTFTQASHDRGFKT